MEKQDDSHNKRSDWLPDSLGDRLDKIKQFVSKLMIDHEDIPQVAYFTPHGTSHLQAVEDNLYRLIPDEYHKKLGEAEKFFLLGAAWLHDIGMLKGIFHEENEKYLRDDVIRENHHIRSAKYITSQYRSLGLKEIEAPAFALLAHYHRRRTPIERCPEYLPVPGHGNIRIKLLAAYLRLADSLHVDGTRAPSEQYAILLTYNIPSKSKLHWLRSKFVIGIDVNIERKQLVVHLKEPAYLEEASKRNKKLGKTFFLTLESIYDVIVQDLNDELNSVKNVLFEHGITYFLVVKSKKHQISFPDHLIADFSSVFNHYHILDNPSSSALFKLVLDSVHGMVRIDSDWKNSDTTQHFDACLREIRSFLDEVNNKVLSTRACHAGLSNLIHEIKQKLKISQKRKSLTIFTQWISSKTYEVAISRTSLRIQAYKYFKNELDHNKKMDEPYNILLYGYSELALKTLCGFRDAVIEKKRNDLLNAMEKGREEINECIKKIKNFTKEFPSSDYQDDGRNMIEKEEEILSFQRIADINPFPHQNIIEKSISHNFNIFCCEGQPKNHIAPEGRILYHDGMRYALALKERGFENIFIIPDAIATSLIVQKLGDEKIPQIDFLIIGANGFDHDKFIHSAGHSMVVASACFQNSQETNPSAHNNKPKTVLALMTDKFEKKFATDFFTVKNETVNKATDDHNSGTPKKECETIPPPPLIDIHGWLYKKNFSEEPPTRKRAFFCQDPFLKESLFHKGISFYNPRQDAIPISFVDVVITERQFFTKQDLNEKKKNENIPFGETIFDNGARYGAMKNAGSVVDSHARMSEESQAKEPEKEGEKGDHPKPGANCRCPSGKAACI